MGEKNKKTNEGENKKKDNSNGNITVVLKADLHCEGCATKVIKCIQNVEGVDTATIGDGQKITVVGKVDPVKLRERVQQKTHKKVELISPIPKKDENKEINGKGKDDSKNKQDANKKDKDNKSGEKKNKEKKEPPVTTAVLKVNLHCEGCIQKIYKHVSKTKGYQDIKIDKQKDLLTVTGAFDMKVLAETLKKHLKRNVEIVPPKKEGEKKENGGAGDKKKSGGGEAAKGGCGCEKLSEGNNKVQQNQVVYPYPFLLYGSDIVGDQIHYNSYAVGPYYAPQIFSDENPNACSVM